jgi:hypothetical protein
MSEAPCRPRARRRGLLTRSSGEDLLVYDCLRFRLVTLDRPATLVWEACDGDRSVEEIRARVEERLGAEMHEQALWHTLKRFQGEGLLEGQVFFPDEARVSTRRELLKLAAAGAVVMVPVVASMVVPVPASAGSGSGSGSGSGTGSGSL